jgi:alginate O-acetyltransferase complex protein AlgI
MPTLQVIIPIGLSFYTFEAINYTVDVYRRHIRAERNFANFMLFILFFPHLVAGPIVRARDFLPQVRRRKRPSWTRFHLGGQLILLGLCKKLVLADQMAQFAEPVFANPAAFDTLTLWLGAIAYAFQVYGDFSGYSDLAVGTAHLLGFRLVENFNMPFLAVNVADLWRRWHISLSTWIRDYLFFPLGGSRGSCWLTFRNLLITMTLCGLWHGANWPMVAWGFLHGLFLCVHLAFRSFCQPRPGWRACLESSAGTTGRIALTFLAFVLSLVVFRTLSLREGAIMFQGMFGFGEGTSAFDPRPVFAAIVLVVLGHVLGINDRWRRLFEPLPSPARGAILAAGLCIILLLAPVTTKTFIYFQF